MIIVDTHCHAGRNWFEPIELLTIQMDSNGVDRAALIQHRGNFDATYLMDCARAAPERFAVVVLVDASQSDAPRVLEGWAEQGAVGVRLTATERSPGVDPLAIWRKARDLGLVVSCQGNVEDFASPEFRGLVAELPDLTIAIEHLAGVGQGAQPPYTTFGKALALADFSNTYIKVPGLGEISHRVGREHPGFGSRPRSLQPAFGFDHTPPLLEMACEAFGPRRMMWGSAPFGDGMRGVRAAPHDVKVGRAVDRLTVT